MTGWETLSDAIATDSDQFGGAYLNRITQLLIGADIAASDATLAPTIGTNWTFKSGKLFLTDVAGTHTINLIPDTQSVNVVIKTPLQSFTPDYISLRKQAETLENKVLDGTKNTFMNLSSSGAAADSSTNVYTGSNTVSTPGYFWFDHVASIQTKDAGLIIYNPAITFYYSLKTSAILANRLVTLPLLTADDTFVFQAMAQPLTNKSISGATNTLTLIPDVALSANVDLTNVPGTTSQLETFLTATMALRNPANTFSTILNAGAVVTANNTLTLPIITDTLVGKTTTDVLTNKSISGATNTLTLIPDAALSGNIALRNASNIFTAGAQFLTSGFVNFNVQTFFQSGIPAFVNPANTFSYFLATSAILANRTIALPLLTADDTFVFAAFPQTLTNKSISGATNTLTNIPDNALSANVVLENIANLFTGQNTINAGWWYFQSPSAIIAQNNVIQVYNPAITFVYKLLTSAITANRNMTLPLLTADDTFVFASFAQTLENKTIGVSDLTLVDTADLILGTTTGSRIGTATTQKLGFYGKAPIVQTSAIASPTSDTVGTKVAIDAIRTALTNLGLTA